MAIRTVSLQSAALSSWSAHLSSIFRTDEMNEAVMWCIEHIVTRICAVGSPALSCYSCTPRWSAVVQNYTESTPAPLTIHCCSSSGSNWPRWSVTFWFWPQHSKLFDWTGSNERLSVKFVWEHRWPSNGWTSGVHVILYCDHTVFGLIIYFFSFVLFWTLKLS